MDAIINVANKSFKFVIMEQSPHPVLLKVLKGDLQGWTQADKDWLQEVAKKTVLEWHGIYPIWSKNMTKTSENTSTTS